MREKSGKVNWVNVVLFFSLALNFFIVGYLVSDVAFFKKFHSKKELQHRSELQIVDYFPEDRRRELRQRMHDKHATIKPLKKRFFGGQRDILELISAKEVDEAGLRQAFQDYQDANGRLQAAFQEILVDMIMAMDYATRQDIYDRAQRAYERRKKHKREHR